MLEIELVSCIAGHVLHCGNTHPEPGGGGRLHSIRQPGEQASPLRLLHPGPALGKHLHLVLGKHLHLVLGKHLRLVLG
jgi:hypothetical protein